MEQEISTTARGGTGVGAGLGRPTRVAGFNGRGIDELHDRIERYLLDKSDRVFGPVPEVGDDGEAETIHQMRVNSRRLRVGLAFFSELFPASELRQVQRQLRRLTRTLGETRALDVNLEWLGKIGRVAPLPARATVLVKRRLEAERAKRQSKLRQLLAGLQVSQFDHRVRALIVTPHRYPDSRRVAAEASDRLNELCGKLRRREKRYRRKQSGRAFHRLRIAAKQYRYGLEAGEAVFGARLKERIRAAERLQDLTGVTHDLEVLGRFVREVGDDEIGRNKGLADEFATVLRTVKREQNRRFARFEAFLDERTGWLKKAKLRLTDG